MEIKGDRKEQQIKIEDLKGQTENLEIPYWKKNILLFKIKLNEQKTGRMIADKERKQQSDRIKK